MSISCIENLSNEILFEIFDYLDGYDIYNGFSNLNYRFQQFLDNPSLLFKMKVDKPSDEKLLNQWAPILVTRTHQTLSLHLLLSSSYMDEYFSTYLLNSSFNHLESITLDYIEEDIVILLLQHFLSFPRLYSLNIHIYDTMVGLSDIYRLIFALPVLKSIKVSGTDWINLESLPVATKKDTQSSQIKYFAIEHRCTFDQLARLTSYTPQLAHLKYNHGLEDVPTVEMILSIPFDNLTHLSMYFTSFDYKHFSVLIKNISSKLIGFKLTVRDDRSICLGSKPWERLIRQHMPQLKKLSLTFYETIYDNNDLRTEDYPWDNQFTSSFWLERQMTFHAKMNTQRIIYSVERYKKTWYDAIDIVTNSRTLLKQKLDGTSAKLTIDHQDFADSEGFLYENVGWITNVTPIYHLELPKQGISIRVLINLLIFLPDLKSLKLWSLFLIRTKNPPTGANDLHDNIKKKNRITKVSIENLIKLREIFYLFDIFRRMKYLEISWTTDIDIQLFIQTSLSTILNKANPHLCSLGFSIKTADDQMVDKLKDIIDSKKILSNYTIKRAGEKIYLKWK